MEQDAGHFWATTASLLLSSNSYSSKQYFRRLLVLAIIGLDSGTARSCLHAGVGCRGGERDELHAHRHCEWHRVGDGHEHPCRDQLQADLLGSFHVRDSSEAYGEARDRIVPGGLERSLQGNESDLHGHVE
jgi:hypothetical protein